MGDQEQRLAALEGWLAGLSPGRSAPPTLGDLKLIADSAASTPNAIMRLDGISRAAVSPHVYAIVDAIAAGTGQPAVATVSEPSVDRDEGAEAEVPKRAGESPARRMEKLVTWHKVQARDGNRGAALPVEDLRRVAQDRSITTAQQIRAAAARLSPGDRDLLSELADELAALLDPRHQPHAPPAVADPAVTEPVKPAQAAVPAVLAQAGRRTTSVTEGNFAPTRATPAGPAPNTLQVERLDEGALRLLWSAHEGPGVVLYRVVSGEQYPPFTPESGDLVGVTSASELIDDRPFTQPRRWVRVWVNVGADEAAAQASQPLLHAERCLVAPVAGAVVRQDDVRVVGSWRVPPGISRVQIQRVPAGQAKGTRLDPASEILPASTNLTGMVDGTAAPDTDYEYRLFAVLVDADGSKQYSAETSVRIKVAAELQAVRDLETSVEHDESGAQVVTLSWTAPKAGEVRVYRTQQPPYSGTAYEALAEAALPGTGLVPDALLGFPVDLDPVSGRARMTQVSWPARWTRACFTAVTFLDGRALASTTLVCTRTAPITDARLAQRVHSQLLTFAWPEGASHVHVYDTPSGESLPTELRGAPLAEIDLDRYEKVGGLRLRLSAQPRSLHLVAVTYDSGRAVPGTSLAVSYAGLVTVRYALELTVQAEPERTGFLQRRPPPTPQAVEIKIWSDQDIPRGLPLVLVRQPDRLPLYVEDGQLVRRLPVEAITAGSGWQVLDRLDPAELAGGFVRLFADIEPNDRLAVLDPPLAQLWWPRQ